MPADSLHDPADAPELESAHAITDSMALLSDFCQELAEEYDEEALAVDGSDSKSSSDVKSWARNKVHNKGQNNCQRSGGSHSKSHDNHWEVSRWQSMQFCQKFHRKVLHQAKEKHCYWNPKLKVFRPKRVCEEMEIPWKPAYKFDSKLDDK